jgi:hypothetical protein
MESHARSLTRRQKFDSEVRAAQIQADATIKAAQILADATIKADQTQREAQRDAGRNMAVATVIARIPHVGLGLRRSFWRVSSGVLRVAGSWRPGWRAG